MLIDYLAKTCEYAQEHLDDSCTTYEQRYSLLEVTSYTVACFLAQNTVAGSDGVEFDIVLEELATSPPKKAEEWKLIIGKIAEELGELTC